MTAQREPGFFVIAFERSVFFRAVRIALVVGSVLAVINHGDTAMSGDMVSTTILKISLTYLVPYCVATYSAVEAIKRQRALAQANC